MSNHKTTREPQPARYLLMVEDRSNGYYHLYGRVVTQRYEQGRYQPNGPEDEYSGGPLYSGLQLRCQGDEDSRQGTITGSRGGGPVYGFSVEYRDVYAVDLRRAERMAKTLRQLDSKLDKLQAARGYAHTYGAYVGRVAEALGCVGVAYERPARSREMSGERWQWGTVGDGVTWVDRQVDAWVDAARPQPVVTDSEVAQAQA